MDSNSLRFSVDSLLLGEIGERLVTRNYIALGELVKNAYDADSTELTIEFKNTKGNNPNQETEIVLTDNGHGMNFDQINEFWMRIATPNKRATNITPYYGRIKTGSKGIGRFACARLGRRLVLESVAKSQNSGRFERTKVIFEWDKYEPGTTLTEIPNEYTRDFIEKENTYTTLRVLNLREPWVPREFKVLRRQILSLAMVYPTKRAGYHEDPGFTIILKAPEFEKGSGRLSEQVMDAGWGRVKGAVSKDGTATIKLEAMKIGEAEYVFSEKFESIPLVTFDIAVIQRIKEYCRDESTLALYTIDDLFKNWSGVKVFLDGFRVYPFGDPNNDWLGIDEQQARRIGKINPIFERICRNLGVDESRALLNQPRNQNLIGRVLLTNQPNRIFDVPINREGFIENEASKQLRDLLKKAITWTTIYYNHFLSLKGKEKMEKVAEEFIQETEETKKALPEDIPKVLDSAIVVLNEAYKDYKRNVPTEKRTKAGKHFDKALTVVKETTTYVRTQISALRTIASTGALMYVFSHEIHDLINRLGTISNTVELITSNVSDEQKAELTELSNYVKTTQRRLLDQMKLFSGVTSNLADMKKHKIALQALAKEVIDCHSALINKFSIKTENSIPKSLRTAPMLEAEMYSVLLNIVSNAIKVVIAGKGNKIKIEAAVNDEIILRVYDDGVGLSDKNKEKVFDALVADPENRLYPELTKRLGQDEILTVGEGSGLGLSIVRDILKGYGKTIRFLKDEEVPKPWKTCVEVTLPK